MAPCPVGAAQMARSSPAGDPPAAPCCMQTRAIYHCPSPWHSGETHTLSCPQFSVVHAQEGPTDPAGPTSQTETIT